MQHRKNHSKSGAPSLSLLLLGGFAAIVVSPELALANEAGFAGGVIRRAYCDILSLMEGEFGGLLMTAAGVVGLAGVAFGNMQRGATPIIAGIAAACIAMGTAAYFGDMGCATGQEIAVRQRTTENPFAVLRNLESEEGLLDAQLDSEEYDEPSDPFGQIR